MHTKKDFEGQNIDTKVIYQTCAGIAAITGLTRVTVFNHIKSGKLPAIWGSVLQNSHCKGIPCVRPNRAWLIHPDDADKYIKNRTNKESPKGRIR